jgi:hypothetical protein
MNPEITQDVVVNSTPQLVFSGTGKVWFGSVNGHVRFGDANLALGNTLTWADVPAGGFNFCAPAEVYAICINGQTNQGIKVQRWF